MLLLLFPAGLAANPIACPAILTAGSPSVPSCSSFEEMSASLLFHRYTQAHDLTSLRSSIFNLQLSDHITEAAHEPSEWKAASHFQPALGQRQSEPLQGLAFFQGTPANEVQPNQTVHPDWHNGWHPPVPEPSTWVLMVSGLLMGVLGYFGRRARSARTLRS